MHQESALRTNLYNDVLNVLELWLHQVLFYRQVYPPHHFTQRTAFQVTVHVAKASLLNRYIT